MFSASDFICFPLAPWEQVIRFGELLSQNGSYLPGNRKWASVMWKDYGKIFLGWERCGGGGARDWRKRSCNGQCQRKLVSLRILLQWWLLVSLFPWGTAALSSWAHFHNKNTHAHPLTLMCTYTQSSDTAFCLLGISLFFWDRHTQSFTAAHMNLVLWGTEQNTHAMSCTVPPSATLWRPLLPSTMTSRSCLQEISILSKVTPYCRHHCCCCCCWEFMHHSLVVRSWHFQLSRWLEIFSA